MAQEIDALRQRAQETKVRLYRLWLRADAEKPENDALTDACDTIRDLLAALEAQQGGWQPMETAPKDGTKILVWTLHGDIEISNWYQSWWPEYVEAGDGLYRRENRLSGEGWNSNYPLFWAPLPAAPDGWEAVAERVRAEAPSFAELFGMTKDEQ
jgi:hypothetical protein